MVERGRIVSLAFTGQKRGRRPGHACPGGRIIVPEAWSAAAAVDGEYAGTISGGCLETELVKKAAWAVRSGAIVERYSTTFEDTSDIPYGLGCGGTVDLLLDPSGTPEFVALLKALKSSLHGREWYRRADYCGTLRNFAGRSQPPLGFCAYDRLRSVRETSYISHRHSARSGQDTGSQKPAARTSFS